jgi:hypothetical protein
MDKVITEYCPLCAIKHIARAKARLAESKLGYPHEFWSALGEISLAEDHLVEQQPALAEAIREHRKKLESAPLYRFPANNLMLAVADVTGYALPAAATSWLQKIRSRWLASLLAIVTAVGAQAGGMSVTHHGATAGWFSMVRPYISSALSLAETPDLVAWFKMDDNANDYVLTDSSWYNYPGALSIAYTAWLTVDGVSGTALAFNDVGGSSVAVASGPALLAALSGTGDYTINMFAKRANNSEHASLFIIDGHPFNVSYYNKDVGQLLWYGHEATATAVVDLEVDEWYMITYVKSGSSSRVYVDNEVGVTVGSPTLTPLTATSFTFGGAPESPGNTRTIDDVKVFKRALSPSEIMSYGYGLVARYPMDDNAANRIMTDTTVYSNNAVLGTGNTDAKAAPGIIGTAFSFAASDYTLITNRMVTSLVSSNDSEYTISYFFKLLDDGHVDMGGLEGMYFDLWFYDDNESVISLFPGGAVDVAKAPLTAQLDTWYHLAIVRKGETATVYVNGQAGTDTGTYEALVSPATSVRLGYLGYQDGAQVVDDLRIYNRALTARQIGLICAEGGISPTAPTVEYVVDPTCANGLWNTYSYYDPEDPNGDPGFWFYPGSPSGLAFWCANYEYPPYASPIIASITPDIKLSDMQPGSTYTIVINIAGIYSTESASVYVGGNSYSLVEGNNVIQFIHDGYTPNLTFYSFSPSIYASISSINIYAGVPQ